MSCTENDFFFSLLTCFGNARLPGQNNLIRGNVSCLEMAINVEKASESHQAYRAELGFLQRNFWLISATRHTHLVHKHTLTHSHMPAQSGAREHHLWAPMKLLKPPLQHCREGRHYRDIVKAHTSWTLNRCQAPLEAGSLFLIDTIYSGNILDISKIQL